jgi:hypothetical protein
MNSVGVVLLMAASAHIDTRHLSIRIDGHFAFVFLCFILKERSRTSESRPKRLIGIVGVRTSIQFEQYTELLILVCCSLRYLSRHAAFVH